MTQLVVYGLIAISVSAFIRWLLKSSNEAAVVTGDQKKLTYGLPLRLLGIIAGILAPIGIAIVVPTKPGEEWLALAMASFFLVPGGYFLVESLSVVVIDRSGIRKKSIWKGAQEIKWNEIKAVSYSKNLSCFVLESFTGEKIRISMFIKGINQFVQDLEAAVSREKLTDAKVGILISKGELDVYGRPLQK